MHGWSLGNKVICVWSFSREISGKSDWRICGSMHENIKQVRPIQWNLYNKHVRVYKHRKLLNEILPLLLKISNPWNTHELWIKIEIVHLKTETKLVIPEKYQFNMISSITNVCTFVHTFLLFIFKIIWTLDEKKNEINIR